MAKSLKSRIVIIGASGFIGFHLSKAIHGNWGDSDLVLIDNFIRSTSDEAFRELCRLDRVSFKMGDVTESTFIEDCLLPGDIVINLAALNGTQNFYEKPGDVLHHSAVSALMINRVAAIVGASRYVYFGSSEVYADSINAGLVTLPTPENVPFLIQDPTNPRWSYASAKQIGEISCHAYHLQYGLDYQIFRIHNIYGPRMGMHHVIPDLIMNFSKDNPQVMGVEQTRCFMFVSDAVRVILDLIKNDRAKNQVINIGSDAEITILDLALKISTLVNPNLIIDSIPAPAGSVSRRQPDLAHMKSLTKSWADSIDIDEGLRLTKEWYLRNL
jgi:UDP-glucose 4-epimerase